MSEFQFSMSSRVEIACSGEKGVVIGRASYAEYPNCYWVRYATAQGVAREEWWNESALKAA